MFQLECFIRIEITSAAVDLFYYLIRQGLANASQLLCW